MRSIFISMFLAISVAFAGCAVKTPLVERLSRDDTGYKSWSGNGIVYALPKLGFDVQFDVRQTELDVPRCNASELTDEQQEAMEIDPEKIESRKRKIYTLHSTTLTKRSVPDPARVFISRFPESSGWADSSLLVKMGPDGTVEGTESSAVSKSVAIATKLIEFTGSVGAAVIAMGSGVPKPSFDECKAKADQYMELQKELSKFRAMPTPYPKDTLEQYINEIKAEQAVIQALFIGKPTVLKGSINCFVVPDKAGATDLLKIVPKKGFIPLEDVLCYMDERFDGRDKDISEADKSSTVSMNVEIADDVMKTAYRAGPSPAPNSAGFFYSVPVRAFVSLSGHAKATTDQESYFLPQLGDVRSLPQVEGSSPALIVNLDPETGALKSVKVSNNAADIAGMLGSTGTSVSNLINAETAKATKQDPLAVLKREQALLEAELAIATAKEALAQLE